MHILKIGSSVGCLKASCKLAGGPFYNGFGSCSPYLELYITDTWFSWNFRSYI